MSRNFGFKVSKPGFDVNTAQPYELAITSSKVSELIIAEVAFTHSHANTTVDTTSVNLTGFGYAPQYLLYEFRNGAFVPSLYEDVTAAEFEAWSTSISATQFIVRTATTNNETFSATCVLYLLYNPIV